MALQEKFKFCAFLDVLGYGNIVMSGHTNTKEKIEKLEDIYMNCFATAAFSIKQINRNYPGIIFVKSYSDCIYLESEDVGAVLCVIYNFFNKVLGYNCNYPEGRYTPLIRAGVVHDWTLQIMDIGSLTRHSIEQMPDNEDYKNMIGLGVARSYYIAEKSNLSGMRIILSPEVAQQLSYVPYTKVPFECYSFEITNYLQDTRLSNSEKSLRMFLLPVRADEESQIVNLYELCWPVFKYEFKKHNSDIDILIQELVKMEKNFDENSLRHLSRTAELMHKALVITQAEHTAYNDEFVKGAKQDLERLSKLK